VLVIGRNSSSKDASSEGGRGKARQQVNTAGNVQRCEDERVQSAE
jgi:hypothetical protein